MFSYGHQPFVLHSSDGSSTSIVTSLATLDLQVGIGLGHVDIGIDMPLHLRVAGDGNPGWSTPEFGDVAPGDLRILPRFRLLDVNKKGFGLAIAVPVTLPTGDESKFVGEATPSVSIQALLEGRIGRVRILGNVGGRLAPFTDGARAFTGPAFEFGVGADVAVVGPLSIAGEVFGRIPQAVDQRALEWLAGVTVRPADFVSVRVAGGTGMSPGVGTPAFRVVGGVFFAPRIPVPGADEPEAEPEPEPEPEPTGPVTRKITVNVDADGAWFDAEHPHCIRLPADAVLELDGDAAVVNVGAPGYETAVIEVPAGSEDVALDVALVKIPEPRARIELDVQDSEGVVEGARVVVDGGDARTSSATGIVRLAVPPGDHEILITSDGHNPVKIALPADDRTRIYRRVVLQSKAAAAAPEFPERVYFAVGKFDLTKKATATLRAVADRATGLSDDDVLTLVGMADPRGGRELNQELAGSRSKAVRDSLRAMGATCRLEVQLELPAGDPATMTEAELQEMRRVEFRLRRTEKTEE